MKRIAAVGVAAATTLTVAACGGSSSSKPSQTQLTARTQLCVKVLLDEIYLKSPKYCADTGIIKIVASQYQVNVSCTHKTGDQYVCLARTYEPIDGQRTRQFYNVTNDGHTIAALPTG